jgi:hypothetical protein
MLSEFSQRMQSQLGQQRDAETEARAIDVKRVEELKKKVGSQRVEQGTFSCLLVLSPE